MDTLSGDELRRYSRHLVMPEVTLAGQQALKSASVLCVGAGGLGSPLCLYLAAAGIGRLGLVEFDTVDISNIQRQILYATADVGRGKLDAAVDRLGALNPHCVLEPHPVRLAADNVAELVAGYDVIVDGSDNFATRYLVNDAAVLAGKPVVHASVFRFEGQLSVFHAPRGPCYRCLYPEPPPAELVPSCAEGGVMGVLPGILGTMQALEVIKLVLDQGQPLLGRLLLFDGLGSVWRELPVTRVPDCTACGETALVRPPIGAAQVDRDSEPPGETAPRISVEELAQRLAAGQPLHILDVRESHEEMIAALPGARLIPLADLPDRMTELAREHAWVISCHHGGRSERAWRLLRAAGFARLQVLDGGIDTWAERIDPSVARY